MHPFPSIKQFRNVVQHVKRKASFVGLDAAGEPIYNHAAKAPTLTFTGTVKLHGTNAAVVLSPEGLSYQSRERVLSEGSDNAGFYAHMFQYPAVMGELCALFLKAANLEHLEDPTIAIFGEWCGGNIQKGVAISQLKKMFVIFAVQINGEWFNEHLPVISIPEAGIYSITNFPAWTVTIDFDRPEDIQNYLGELTQMVEAECPVGKHFLVQGIGEGIVWRCVEDPNPDLWFKVKGEKHSASKVKTLAAVDTEAVESMRDFIEKVVTEARLEQALKHLQEEQKKPFNMTSIGDFIRWIYSDVVKEESDTMAASGIDPKKIGSPIAQAAKRWYVERLNQVVFQHA